MSETAVDLFAGGGGMWEVRQGNALDLLRALPASSIDAVVTDPPYGERAAKGDAPRDLGGLVLDPFCGTGALEFPA